MTVLSSFENERDCPNGIPKCEFPPLTAKRFGLPTGVTDLDEGASLNERLETESMLDRLRSTLNLCESRNLAASAP